MKYRFPHYPKVEKSLKHFFHKPKWYKTKKQLIFTKGKKSSFFFLLHHRAYRYTDSYSPARDGTLSSSVWKPEVLNTRRPEKPPDFLASAKDIFSLASENSFW